MHGVAASDGRYGASFQLPRSSRECVEPLSAVTHVVVKGLDGPRVWLVAGCRSAISFLQARSPAESGSTEPEIWVPMASADVFQWPGDELGVPLMVDALAASLLPVEASEAVIPLVIATTRGTVALLWATFAQNTPSVLSVRVNAARLPLGPAEVVWAAAKASQTTDGWSHSLEVSLMFVVATAAASPPAAMLVHCVNDTERPSITTISERLTLPVPEGFRPRGVSLTKIAELDRPGRVLAVVASDGHQSFVALLKVMGSPSRFTVLRCEATSGPWEFPASAVAEVSPRLLFIGDSNNGRLMAFEVPARIPESDCLRRVPRFDVQLSRPAMSVTAVESFSDDSVLVAATHELAEAPAFVIRTLIPRLGEEDASS